MKLAGLWKKTTPPIAPLPKIELSREPERAAPPTVSDETEGESQDYSVASETLARIMLDQGKLVEARKIYIQISRDRPDEYERLSVHIRAIDEKLAQDRR
jgi:hypothetical protein